MIEGFPKLVVPDAPGSVLKVGGAAPLLEATEGLPKVNEVFVGANGERLNVPGLNGLLWLLDVEKAKPGDELNGTSFILDEPPDESPNLFMEGAGGVCDAVASWKDLDSCLGSSSPSETNKESPLSEAGVS